MAFQLRTAYDLLSASQAFLLEEAGFPEGERRIVTALTVKPVKRGAYVEPTFRLDPDQVQELFDQLWKQGYRPKDGTGNSGHVAAINYHLEDMRRLVFEREKP